jgi:Protein kinase domain
MPLAPGTKLGPYEILSVLGAGGMGEVYRARDTRLDHSVAIKILPAHLSADLARKLRFEREAKTVSALNHPNICSLFDVGSQDGTDSLVRYCVTSKLLINGRNTAIGFSTVCFTAASAILLLPTRTRFHLAPLAPFATINNGRIDSFDVAGCPICTHILGDSSGSTSLRG